MCYIWQISTGTVGSRYLEANGTVFYKFKLPEVQIFGLVKKVSNIKLWLEKANVFLIQIDASSFAEFEISEFEISRYRELTVGALCQKTQHHANALEQNANKQTNKQS